MNRGFSIVDLIQRRINSLLFRLTLIVFSILILCFSVNYFTTFSYIIIEIFYLIFYFLCDKKVTIRLINDFAFIVLILLGKDPLYIINYTLIILPIVNSINFSGEKKTPYLLYVFTVFCFLLLIYIFNGNFKCTNIGMLLPILSLGFINYYTNQRLKIQKNRDEIIGIVDDFYVDEKNIKRPYKIYFQVIKKLNNIIKQQLFQNVYCFTVLNGKIITVNGTNYLWNFEFLNDEFYANLKGKKILYNESVILDGELKDKCLVINTSVGNNEYFYLFTLNDEIPRYLEIIDFFTVLNEVLQKISRILVNEKQMQLIRYAEVKELSEKRNYVNRANNMMHFIRNRLSPFSNLIVMLDNMEKISDDKLNDFKIKLNEQNNRAKIELKSITDRADDMLEKTKNPFFYSILEDVSTERAFTLLRRLFLTYFPDKNIQATIDNNKKLKLKLNQEGYEIFISDWLNNIKKYHKDHILCVFKVENNYLYISFENDHNQTKEQINELLDDLNNNDRNEIIKRTTHGLYTIKTMLNEMGIKYEVKHYNGILMLTLLIKLNENESSDF